MYVCDYMHAWYLQGSEGGIGTLGSGITNGCEPPCECYELNPDPL